MVAVTCNPSSREAETGGSLGSLTRQSKLMMSSRLVRDPTSNAKIDNF